MCPDPANTGPATLTITGFTEPEMNLLFKMLEIGYQTALGDPTLFDETDAEAWPGLLGKLGKVLPFRDGPVVGI